VIIGSAASEDMLLSQKIGISDRPPSKEGGFMKKNHPIV